jgi:acyl carrier protein
MEEARVITKSEIRSIVSASSGVELSSVKDETEFAIDSLTLLTLQHLFETRYGIVIEPTAEDMRRFTSVNGIHAYLFDNFPSQVK